MMWLTASPVSSFLILTEVLHVWTSHTFDGLPSLGNLELCRCLHKLPQLCLDHCADSWYIRTCPACTLLHCENLLAFSWGVSRSSSAMFLIFIQTVMARTELLCNYNWQFWASLPAAISPFHKLQVHDWKLQYSHNLVGFISYLSCLFAGYVTSRFWRLI
jgi:hypothetical protein